MRKPDSHQAAQAVVCLLCFMVLFRTTVDLDGSEFSGGSLTGPLLSMADYGDDLFTLALVLTFIYRRIGAAVALASSLLGLPLYLFFLAPVPFGHAFGRGHPFKGDYSPGLHWEKWTVVGLLSLVATGLFCIHSIAVRGGASPNRRLNVSDLP